LAKIEMITLNLISPEQKKELGLRRFYILIKNLTIIFLLFTTILAIIMLIAKMIIQNNFNKVVNDYSLTTRYSRIVNYEMENFDKQLNFIVNVQNDYIPWTNFIASFINSVPPEINLYSVDLGKTDSQMKINGFAQNRDDLLKFKGNLENLPLLSEINVPMGNLLKKESIEFEIEAKINLEELKKL